MKVFIAGHRGMVGSAIYRKLASRDVEILTRSRGQLDLTDQASVQAYLNVEKPDAVILALERHIQRRAKGYSSLHAA